VAGVTQPFWVRAWPVTGMCMTGSTGRNCRSSVGPDGSVGPTRWCSQKAPTLFEREAQERHSDETDLQMLRVPLSD